MVKIVDLPLTTVCSIPPERVKANRYMPVSQFWKAARGHFCESCKSVNVFEGGGEVAIFKNAISKEFQLKVQVYQLGILSKNKMYQGT